MRPSNARPKVSREYVIEVIKSKIQEHDSPKWTLERIWEFCLDCQRRIEIEEKGKA